MIKGSVFVVRLKRLKWQPIKKKKSPQKIIPGTSNIRRIKNPPTENSIFEQNVPLFKNSYNYMAVITGAEL